MCVCDWCVTMARIQAWRVGRQMRKEAVAQRYGAEYSSTCRRRSVPSCCCGEEVVMLVDVDVLRDVEADAGAVALSDTSS